jgi:hypothetical protein
MSIKKIKSYPARCVSDQNAADPALPVGQRCPLERVARSAAGVFQAFALT